MFERVCILGCIVGCTCVLRQVVVRRSCVAVAVAVPVLGRWGRRGFEGVMLFWGLGTVAGEVNGTVWYGMHISGGDGAYTVDLHVPWKLAASTKGTEECYDKEEGDITSTLSWCTSQTRKVLSRVLVQVILLASKSAYGHSHLPCQALFRRRAPLLIEESKPRGQRGFPRCLCLEYPLVNFRRELARDLSPGSITTYDGRKRGKRER